MTTHMFALKTEEELIEQKLQ